MGAQRCREAAGRGEPGSEGNSDQLTRVVNFRPMGHLLHCAGRLQLVFPSTAQDPWPSVSRYHVLIRLLV